MSKITEKVFALAKPVVEEEGRGVSAGGRHLVSADLY